MQPLHGCLRDRGFSPKCKTHLNRYLWATSRDLEFRDMFFSALGDFATIFVHMTPYSLVDTGAICYIMFCDRRHDDGTNEAFISIHESTRFAFHRFKL